MVLVNGPGAQLGARVRIVREGRRVSLRELARRLDLSPATITALEKGRTTLSIDRVHAIAKALDVPAAALFSDSTVDTFAVDQPGEPSPVGSGSWREFADLDMDVVLRAALTCIVRKGYHGCSIREIAEEAGLSVAALYHYYPGKQAMLVALFELTMTDLMRRCTAARDEFEPESPQLRFSRLIESLTLYHSHRKDLSFLGWSEMRSLEGENHATIAAKRVALQRMVDAELAAGVRLGFFTTTRPQEASRALVTMCIAVAQWFNPDGNVRPEEIAASYVQFALDMVGLQD